MGKNTDMVCRFLSGVLIVAMVGVLNGCAQPQRGTTHKSNYKSDFAARLDIAVNYHLESDSGIVVVDLYNPRTSDIRLWLVQSSITDGQSIVASRRFYEGKKKKHQEIFRVPLPLEGIVETFFVEVFDINGKLILKSEPIKHSPQEGQP